MKEYIPLGDVITKASVERCGDRDLPILSITMKDGLIMQDEKFKKRIASVDTADYKVIPRGLLVQGIHIDEANFGIQDIVDAGIVSPAYKVWKVKEDVIYPKYLETIMRSPRSLAYYKSKLNGSVNRRGRMSDDEFLNMPIPYVDISEQKKIIDILNQTKTIIDDRSKILENFDTLIKARFVEMFGDVIHNTMGWPQHVFSEIASSRLGKMLDAKQQTGKYQYPYLANFNVQWFRFDLSSLNKMDFDEDDQIEFELRDGDLIVCEGGEIGRCAVWHNQVQPCYFQKALHRVRCNTELIIPDYLARWFQYNCKHKGFAAIEGAKATIAHLPGAKLKALQVVVPPVELQNQFAIFVSQVDKSKAVVQQALAKDQLLFDSLMQQYFG